MFINKSKSYKPGDYLSWTLTLLPLALFLDCFFIDRPGEKNLSTPILVFLVIVISFILAFWDAKRLRKAGFAINAYIVWMIPAYLYLRAKCS